MEKINVKSLYLGYINNNHKKPYQIIGAMKSLALSTLTFNNFYNSATNLYHKKSFKLPNETHYPIIRKSQSKYISLKTKLNTFSFHDKKDNNTESIKSSKKIRIKKIFSEEKKNQINDIKKKKNINFFICENNYGGKYNKLFERGFNKNNKHSRNKKFPPPDFYKNFRSFGNIYPVEEIKSPEERIKDFFMFLNTIFIKDNYNNLKYDENEIFGHKEDYLKYIKDEFNYFYQKEKEVEKKAFLFQVFKTKDYGNVELYLKSARIEIVDDSYKNNNVKLSISIPFNLMCLIYLINIEQLNKIIFYLINKLSITEENNVLSEEESKNLFLEILSKTKYENNNILLELESIEIKKNYERYYSKINFLEKIQFVSESIRFSYFLSDFYKNPEIIKIKDNTNYSVYCSINSNNKKRIIFKNNINYYKIIMISQNYNKYRIQLVLPEVSMIFNDYEKQLNHCISKELFIFLYQNNFMDWDFYILHYLFYQKNFRFFIGRVLSLKNNFNLFLTKNIINLNKNKIEFSKDIKKDINISSSINNSFKKYYLSSFYSSKFKINENDVEFMFSCLNQKDINFCILKSYTIYAFINNINKPNIYEFNFNFKQMRILYFSSLFKNFEIFLKRLIYIKSDIIYLDYSNFENFYSMTNNEIYEYFYRLNKNNKEEEINDENSSINTLKLKVREPHIEIIANDVKNKSLFQFHIELNKDFLKILVNNDVTEWKNIIEENKSLFHSSKYIKYEDIKVKKVKRKKVAKGKRKDFQSAFMSFLRLSSKNN